MRLLHTSDWHIGRALHERKRYDEMEVFLNWLASCIESEGIDVLLVAGDVFDSTTPSNRAQELYYRFLCRVTATAHRHVVVIAGNHDSPSFLNAPREILKSLRVHVVGSASPVPEEEVFVLTGADGEPRLIVCAVPYLRDRDIRTADPGESVEEKERKIIEGIRTHYRLVGEAAEETRRRLGKPVPIVAMGHLFAAGGRTAEGDGVRELYIGSLAQVGKDVFPECIDYLALGHLHIPQRVGGEDCLRYCGSPLPMGFGEARQEKNVILVDCIAGRLPAVRPVPVPRFQELASLRGDWPAIAGQIEDLKRCGSTAWLEIVYEGEDIAAGLRERSSAAVDGTGMEILRIKNSRILERALGGRTIEETLDDLDVTEVFVRCLDAHDIPADRHAELLGKYRECVTSLHENDQLAD